MRILPEILLAMAGLSLGFFIASGLVALVIGLGIVTRYAGITKTAESLRFYECCCMAGALFGDLFSLGTFSFSLPSWTAVCSGFLRAFIWEAGSSRSAKSSTCFRSSAAGSD